MIKWISEAMKHYDDPNLFSVIVVNELFKGDGSLNHNPWSDIEDYVCLAFRTARAANPDPRVTLMYNDFNILAEHDWYKPKSDAVFNMVKNMK